MTTARRQLVDLSVTRYYHCISRCVRQAMLCGEGVEHRKQWIEDRLETLAGAFAVAVCGFAVMDNHLHLLLRLDPDLAKGWSDEEVLRRWMAVYPPALLDDDNAELVQAWINLHLKNAKRVAKFRDRLANLGWFMKALKEPLARAANKEDDCQGNFWQSRFKSIAILDDEALLTTCAYIDLNPLAAGISSLPETSRHTSIRQRVKYAREQGKLEALKRAAKGSVAGSRAAGDFEDFEQEHWLCPWDDQRPRGAPREGMLPGFSLGSYLLLVDYTSRLCRTGKARLSEHVASILARLDTSAEVWNLRITRLFAQPRLKGNYFAGDAEKLRDLATRRGRHHLHNVTGSG